MPELNERSRTTDLSSSLTVYIYFQVWTLHEAIKTLPSKALASSLWLPNSDGTYLLTFPGKPMSVIRHVLLYIRKVSRNCEITLSFTGPEVK